MLSTPFASHHPSAAKLIQPHCYMAARRRAEADRREAIHDFWRSAGAVWGRLQQSAAERLGRSTARLQARLARRQTTG